MYNKNRLSGIRRKTQIIVNLIDSCVVLLDNKPTFDLRHTFVVALAKSQDHRVIYEVFSFGLHNAVRRWLCTRYPVTRASQSREGGRIARAWWLIKSGRCDAMRWLREHLSTSIERNWHFDAVRLCFAQRFTKNTI